MYSGTQARSWPAGEQGVADVLVPPAVADVPLAGGDDLERAVALLVELHRVRDGPGLADHLAALGQQLDDAGLGLLHRLAGQLGVGGGGPVALDAGRRGGQDAAVAVDHGADRQVQLPPPGDVGGVAEGADHGDARALVGLREVVGVDRDLDVEQRRADGAAEQRLVALVVGVGDQRDAGGDQLRPGGLDEDVAVGAVEGDAVVGAGPLPVLQLGLGHRGVEVDVPEGGRLGGVGLAPGQVAQERPLRGGPGAVVDGGVGEGPVDGEPEGPPQVLEGLLVLDGERLAQLDEVPPGDRHLLLAG
jgi:hypothetical protein